MLQMIQGKKKRRGKKKKKKNERLLYIYFAPENNKREEILFLSPAVAFEAIGNIMMSNTLPLTSFTFFFTCNFALIIGNK